MAFDIHKYSQETFWGLVILGAIFLFLGIAFSWIRPWWAGCIAVMLIFDLGIYVIFAHFDPQSKKPADNQSSKISVEPVDRPLTLKKLFDTDFKSGHILTSLTTKCVNDERTLKIPCLVITDFPSRTKFLAFYIEDVPDAYERCGVIADFLQAPIEQVNNSISMTMINPGETSKTELQDLTFTGRVFIYHETHFSLQQLASLEAIFGEKKAAVQFRGYSYLVLHWNENRVLPKKNGTSITGGTA